MTARRESTATSSGNLAACRFIVAVDATRECHSSNDPAITVRIRRAGVSRMRTIMRFFTKYGANLLYNLTVYGISTGAALYLACTPNELDFHVTLPSKKIY